MLQLLNYIYSLVFIVMVYVSLFAIYFRNIECKLESLCSEERDFAQKFS